MFRAFTRNSCRLTNQISKLVVFDIDGVILRGDIPVKGARETLANLTDNKVPYAFLTNGCPCSEKDRTKFLSKVLDFNIPERVMFMSQSPFKELSHMFKKRVLVVSNNDYRPLIPDFTNVCTIKELAEQFPYLDSVNRNCITGSKNSDGFQYIEGIIFLEDPRNWETALQLILDVIFTGGTMQSDIKDYLLMHDLKQVPSFVASTDFLWVTEAPWQRIAHGVFLHNLESTFKRLTGKQLKYTEVFGKPNLSTYQYLHKKLYEVFSCSGIENLYFIGDNIFTDIYGANIFGDHLSSGSVSTNVHSFLVETGVYNRGETLDSKLALGMLHKDTPKNLKYLTPTNTFPSILEAITHILKN